MTDGVIYVAAGADYLDLAIRSARSLRALNAGLAVDLFTDQPVEPGLFDRVRPIPDGADAEAGGAARDAVRPDAVSGLRHAGPGAAGRSVRDPEPVRAGRGA